MIRRLAGSTSGELCIVMSYLSRHDISSACLTARTMIKLPCYYMQAKYTNSVEPDDISMYNSSQKQRVIDVALRAIDVPQYLHSDNRSPDMDPRLLCCRLLSFRAILWVR